MATRKFPATLVEWVKCPELLGNLCVSVPAQQALIATFFGRAPPRWPRSCRRAPLTADMLHATFFRTQMDVTREYLRLLPPRQVRVGFGVLQSALCGLLSDADDGIRDFLLLLPPGQVHIGIAIQVQGFDDLRQDASGHCAQAPAPAVTGAWDPKFLHAALWCSGHLQLSRRGPEVPQAFAIVDKGCRGASSIPGPSHSPS